MNWKILDMFYISYSNVLKTKFFYELHTHIVIIMLTGEDYRTIFLFNNFIIGENFIISGLVPRTITDFMN